MLKQILVALTLGAFVLAAGCGKKDDKKGEAKPTDKTAPAGDVKAGPAGAPATPTAPATPVAADPAAAPAVPAAAPAGGDPAKIEMANKMLAMFDKIIAAVTKNADNCDAMAAALQAVVTEAKPLMEQAKAMEKSDPGAKEWFEANYGKQLEEKMTQMLPGMMKCAENPAVQEAMKGLGDDE
jgi:hypothetical protein